MFDPFVTYAHERDGGFHLGDRRTNRLGDWIFSKAASEDIAANVGVMASPVNQITSSVVTVVDPTHFTLDPEVAVEENAWAGCRILITNAANESVASIVKSNAQGFSGKQMAVELLYGVALTDGSSSSVTVVDPQSMISWTADGINDVQVRPAGICPVAVVFATKPYFWRQASGRGVPVMCGDTTAAGKLVCASDNAKGQVFGAANGETVDDVQPVGVVVLAAPAADKLCLIDMFPLN